MSVRNKVTCERDSEIKSGSESGTRNESCSARGEIERAVRSAAVANLCDIDREIVAFLDHEGVEHTVKLF